MRSASRLGIALLAVLVLTAGSCSTAAPRRHLLIVVDGLRPDYVTADVMPNLTALGKRGVVFTPASLGLSDGDARERLVDFDRLPTLKRTA